MKKSPKRSKRRILANISAQKGLPKSVDHAKREDNRILGLSLRSVREKVGLSQEALAVVMDMTQSDLSKLERREDHLVSRLRLFVESLGGVLEVSAILNGQRIVLTDV